MIESKNWLFITRLYLGSYFRTIHCLPFKGTLLYDTPDACEIFILRALLKALNIVEFKVVNGLINFIKMINNSRWKLNRK